MNVLIVSMADVARCPIRSLSASHYYRADDGRIACECFPIRLTPDAASVLEENEGR